jgi:putative membrane protein
MKKSALILFLLLTAFQKADAQGTDTTGKDSTAASAISTSGNVNTGAGTNTGVLSSDTSASVFVLQAVAASEKEIVLGRLANKKAVNNKVKDFGAQMVKDHSQAIKELKKIAFKKKMVIPTSSFNKDQLSSKLAAKMGDEFDRAYIAEMIFDHENALSLFEKASSGINDPEIKTFAQMLLPVLKHHYNMAKSISQNFQTSSGN